MNYKKIKPTKTSYSHNKLMSCSVKVEITKGHYKRLHNFCSVYLGTTDLLRNKTKKMYSSIYVLYPNFGHSQVALLRRSYLPTATRIMWTLILHYDSKTARFKSTQ
jgi:hypothetical protein